MIRFNVTFVSQLKQRNPFCNKVFKSRVSVQNAGFSSSSSSTTPLDTTKASAQESTAGVQSSSGSGKLLAREPLAKNFFIGVVDRELLAFPEVIAREDLTNLKNGLVQVKNFIAQSEFLHSAGTTEKIPNEVINSIRDLGLYALNVPQDYGGKGWEWSASLMAMEEESQCPDLALSLLSHRVVIDILNTLGSDSQKQQFLPKLADGSLYGCEAIYELSPLEYEYFNTSAEYDSVSKSWTLNGKKSFVITGQRPEGSEPLYLVLAQTSKENVRDFENRFVTAFLIDARTNQGIKIDKQHSTFGCKAVQSSTVLFENVKVPISSVLSQPHEGNVLADKLLTPSRLRQSLMAMIMIKNIVNNLTQYFIETKQCGVSLYEMNINRTHLSEGMCAAYSIESMIYFTAGLMDEFEEQDVALEAAITKYFALRELCRVCSKYMDLFGPKSLLAGQLSEKVIRDAAHLYTQGETMDMLSLFVASAGLQRAGIMLMDSVNKMRNPFFHPMHVVSKILRNSSVENPKIPKHMRLRENLHPSLEPAAQGIEKSVVRLQMAVEILFNQYGAGVIEEHGEMRRLTEMVTHIYSMFASVSRASRSYCIGLPMADQEVLLALTIAAYGTEQVKKLCSEVFFGKYGNNDHNFHRVGKQVAVKKGYFATHPLTYNF